MTNVQARQPRFVIRLSAELRVDGKPVTGVTRNLSVGGVCVEIDRPIAEASAVELTLFVVEDDVEVAGAHGLDLMGVVQWAAEAERGWAIGLKFEALSQAQTAALNAALKSISR